MAVLITRAEPAASQTSKRIEQAGHDVIVLPLFEVSDLKTQIPNADYDGVIFTSKNAVEVLATREFGFKNIPAYCVGEKTKQAAEALGFTKTHVANGGGAVLADLMGKMKLEGQTLLYPTTPDRSYDMQTALEPSGIKVKSIDIYQVNALIPDQQTFTQTFQKISYGHIFTYSALSATHLTHILETTNLTNALKDCTLIGISKHAVKSLEQFEWKEILVARQPDETCMIELLNQSINPTNYS